MFRPTSWRKVKAPDAARQPFAGRNLTKIEPVRTATAARCRFRCGRRRALHRSAPLARSGTARHRPDRSERKSTNRPRRLIGPAAWAEPAHRRGYDPRQLNFESLASYLLAGVTSVKLSHARAVRRDLHGNDNPGEKAFRRQRRGRQELPRVDARSTVGCTPRQRPHPRRPV